MNIEWKECKNDDGTIDWEANYRGFDMWIRKDSDSRFGDRYYGGAVGAYRKCGGRIYESFESIESYLIDEVDNECKFFEGTWHPYPQEKPTENLSYLVSIKCPHAISTTIATWWDDEFVDIYRNRNDKVIAWAKMPKPYEG